MSCTHTKKTKNPCDLASRRVILSGGFCPEGNTSGDYVWRIIFRSDFAKFQTNPSVTFFVILLTAFLPYLVIVKNPKINLCDLDLWPMTLIFNRLLVVVTVHVRTKFHQARCSGSWVIVLAGRPKNLATMLKTILPSLPIKISQHNRLDASSFVAGKRWKQTKTCTDIFEWNNKNVLARRFLRTGGTGILYVLAVVSYWCCWN